MNRLILSTFVALGLSAFVYRSNHSLQVSHYEINDLQLSNSFRVVQLSDLHIPYSGFKLKRLITEVKKLNPDLILITGDLLDRTLDSIQLEYAKQVITKLKEIAPIYACLGNHDEYLLDSFNDLMIILNNQSTEIWVNDNRVQIMGIKPKSTLKMDVNEDILTLVLDHYPQKAETILKHPWTYQFSGHVHGGQVRLAHQGLFGPDQGFFPFYSKGYYPMTKNSGLFVSAGLGATIIPLRLNNPNHMIVVDFK